MSLLKKLPTHKHARTGRRDCVAPRHQVVPHDGCVREAYAVGIVKKRNAPSRLDVVGEKLHLHGQVMLKDPLVSWNENLFHSMLVIRHNDRSDLVAGDFSILSRATCQRLFSLKERRVDPRALLEHLDALNES